MSRLPSSACALALATSLSFFVAGCGPAPTPVPPKPAPTAVADATPSCPDEIEKGGDPLEAESYEGKSIARVCIVGSAEAKKEALRVVKTEAGGTYTMDRVRGDLDGLLHLGTLDDASTFAIRAGRDAMVLVYVVHERPRIGDIAVTGAKALGDATLTSKLPVEANARFDPAAINTFAQAIRDEYKTRGYETCTVKILSEAAGEGKVKVRIVVTEGPRLFLSKVELKGNAKVKEADLRKAAAIEDKAPLDRTKIDAAVQRINTLYYDRGYVQIRTKPNTAAPGTDGGVVLTLTIDEGDVYSVGELHATKMGGPVEKELLEKVVKLRPKQPFSRQGVVDDMERIKNYFAAKKQVVDIIPTTNIDEKKKTVSLTFEIQPSR